MVIDTHCHILSEEYDNIDEIIEEMKDNILVVSGYNDKTNHEVLQIIHKYPNVYGTIGIHPSEISDIKDEFFAFIEANITDPKIVGIGEIGLDYHFDRSNMEQQKLVFQKQLDIASKNHKTVVVGERCALAQYFHIMSF